MAVRVYCDDPSDLLEKMRFAVETGSLKSWTVDSVGDFTLASDQWSAKAWFRPKIGKERLSFNILGNRSEVMSKRTYAVYHGAVVEMLLRHFDSDFDRVFATSGLDANDTSGREA